MRLKKFQFSEAIGSQNEWILESVDLNEINLIVGRNATGKSRTLRVISALAAYMTARRKLPTTSFYFEAEFNNNVKSYKYILSFNGEDIDKEEVFVDGDQYLERRSGGSGWVFSEKENKNLEFEVDAKVSALSAKKDRIQHPSLIPLHSWAETVKYFQFANSEHQKFGFVQSIGASIDASLDPPTDQAVALWFSAGVAHCKEFSRRVKDDMKSIGYNISDVNVARPEGVSSAGGDSVLVLYVKEKGLSATVWQHQMSQGMFRALAVVIEINYILERNNSGCVLIDDIGEGLDYERSSSLIELIIDRISGTGKQVIMTTNDRFVMNNIPLDYWQIMDRSSHRVKVYNQSNSGKVFQEFSYTGLSNFDFFKSKYFKNSSGGKE